MMVRQRSLRCGSPIRTLLMELLYAMRSVCHDTASSRREGAPRCCDMRKRFVMPFPAGQLFAIFWTMAASTSTTIRSNVRSDPSRADRFRLS
jgi:hypothetical protein